MAQGVLLMDYSGHGRADAISHEYVLKLADFQKYGKPAKISSYFGGKDGYLKAVQDLEDELYTEVG